MGIGTHSAPEIAAGNTVLHGQAVLAVCDGCPVGNRENAWGGGEDRKKLPTKKTHHQRCNLGFKKQLSARSETRNPERSTTPVELRVTRNTRNSTWGPSCLKFQLATKDQHRAGSPGQCHAASFLLGPCCTVPCPFPMTHVCMRSYVHLSCCSIQEFNPTPTEISSCMH